MRQQTRLLKEPAEKVVQDIRRATRKHYSAEEKIRIVLEGHAVAQHEREIISARTSAALKAAKARASD
jgi:hypothetical protein